MSLTMDQNLRACDIALTELCLDLKGAGSGERLQQQKHFPRKNNSTASTAAESCAVREFDPDSFLRCKFIEQCQVLISLYKNILLFLMTLFAKAALRAAFLCKTSNTLYFHNAIFMAYITSQPLKALVRRSKDCCATTLPPLK